MEKIKVQPRRGASSCSSRMLCSEPATMSYKKKSREEQMKEEREKEDKELKEFIWSDKVLTPDAKLGSTMAEKVLKYINVHKKAVYKALSIGEDDYFYPLFHQDNAMYYEMGGLAYMQFHLYLKVSQCRDYDLLNEAMRLLEKPLRSARKMERLTFVAGDAGLLSLAAVLYHYAGRHTESRALLEKVAVAVWEVRQDPLMGMDLLTGRAGYLFCLIFVRKHIPPGKENPITDDIIRKVFNMIIKDGLNTAAELNRGKMLLYPKCFGTVLGAQSGMAGILHTLLQVDVPDLQGLLREFLPGTLEYMMAMKLDCGNRPKTETTMEENFITWRHGSSGWIHLFVKSYELFKDPAYLETAIEAEEVVWKRGYRFLMEDVHSLGNGMCGNGYCHLALFHATRDIKYFQRACRAGMRCFHFVVERNIQPRPYSLMDVKTRSSPNLAIMSSKQPNFQSSNSTSSSREGCPSVPGNGSSTSKRKPSPARKLGTPQNSRESSACTLRTAGFQGHRTSSNLDQTPHLECMCKPGLPPPILAAMAKPTDFPVPPWRDRVTVEPTPRTASLPLGVRLPTAVQAHGNRLNAGSRASSGTWPQPLSSLGSDGRAMKRKRSEPQGFRDKTVIPVSSVDGDGRSRERNRHESQEDCRDKTVISMCSVDGDGRSRERNRHESQEDCGDKTAISVSSVGGDERSWKRKRHESQEPSIAKTKRLHTAARGGGGRLLLLLLPGILALLTGIFLLLRFWLQTMESP